MIKRKSTNILTETVKEPSLEASETAKVASKSSSPLDRAATLDGTPNSVSLYGIHHHIRADRPGSHVVPVVFRDFLPTAERLGVENVSYILYTHFPGDLASGATLP